jgi:AcrR family transcriptional regulator
MLASVIAHGRKPRRPRSINTARRRQQLIEATGRSIVQNGLGATTLATVAREAGLSQGVAIFYFKTKQALIKETLRSTYLAYRSVWQSALAKAPDDPVQRMLALIKADFDPAICNRTTLAVWHAFWGTASEQPLYVEVASEFDAERAAAFRQACEAAADLLDPRFWTPEQLATAVDTLTDGLWHRLYIAPDHMDTDRALDLTLRQLAIAVPSRCQEILAAKSTSG